MGNKILGKRSKSFYKGFNQRQLDYIRQKFELVSKNGSLSKQLFIDAYKINDIVCDRFFGEIDFNEDKSIDQYEFICAVHSLCSMTIQQLGDMFFRIITRGKQNLTQKNLLNFTNACMLYNAYYERKSISSVDITKENKNKFNKYDYDKSGIIEKEEFVKICLKDQIYKKWMFNMGFITQRQLQFQDQLYDLVDSQIEQQISRHQAKCNNNKDKIKRGVQHRIQDDQFQVEQTVGQQSGPPNKPWKNAIANFKRDPKKKQIQQENMSAPSQNLNIDHIYGYRSFDCRNNAKYDSKGRIVYHQGTACIVTQKTRNDKLQQNFLIKHQDDISCLDISDDLAATGQIGSHPMVVLWQTNKKQDHLVENMIITKQLINSVGNVAISRSKKLLAVSCNDEDHKVVIYDLDKLRILQNNLTSKQTGIKAFGTTTKNVIFDLKFNIKEDTLVAATLKDLLFITFDKGSMNTSRGAYKNFSNSPTFCLTTLKTKYNDEQKQFIISGMGNGSIYFWDKQQCVKAVCGHQGSVSALCIRKDCQSFISGDKTGMIIIWDQKYKKQHTIKMPKTNCLSKMIVTLCCNNAKQLLIGTKSADIFELKIGDDISKARRIVGGHSQGKLQALTIHRKDPYFYTGGQDQRIIKWQYKQKKEYKNRSNVYIKQKVQTLI